MEFFQRRFKIETFDKDVVCTALRSEQISLVFKRTTISTAIPRVNKLLIIKMTFLDMYVIQRAIQKP